MLSPKIIFLIIPSIFTEDPRTFEQKPKTSLCSVKTVTQGESLGALSGLHSCARLGLLFIDRELKRSCQSLNKMLAINVELTVFSLVPGNIPRAFNILL